MKQQAENPPVSVTDGEDENEAAKRAALDAVLLDGVAPLPGEEPTPEVPRMSAEESLAGLLQGVSGVLEFSGLKNTAAVWNAETCQRGAAVTVPVLRKYPWGARIIGFLETGSGMEEAALVMFAFPVVMATAKAYQMDTAKKPEQATPERQPGAPGAGGENGITPNA